MLYLIINLILEIIQDVQKNVIQEDSIPQFSNYDLKNIVTPINVHELEILLKESNYDRTKSKFLIEGFKNGFDMQYQGPRNCRHLSNNIPLNVGTRADLWRKIMKEVRLGRYAGPFESPPYKYFIQSPIRLVPKDGGKDMRLIFHLSFDFGKNEEDKSFNHHTPDDLCSVKYRNIDHAIENCLQLIKSGA